MPMISVPLKATNEIDWVHPLKHYIQYTYGDDPERYAEECATLNRLRQDMRGAGKDSTAGRDLLYRYYGQLELLDLRFPVDEQHIKISFTWCVGRLVPPGLGAISCNTANISCQVRRLHPQAHLAILPGFRKSLDNI